MAPGGALFACTRRGDLFRIDGAHADPPSVKITKFASGLHEPLGVLVRPDGIYTTQRGELTRLRDTAGSGRADSYECVCDAWPISGNYHEYSYGPKLDREGNLWITFNVGWTDRGVSLVPWRGWAVKVLPNGTMVPMCAGLRSPAGIGMNSAGDMFMTDNQGDWVGTCKLVHMEKGDFLGHPESLRWCSLPESPLADPGKPPEGKTMLEAKKTMPSLKLPAVWFPYKKMGQSASDIACDETAGRFGPFDGQLFVGDQTTSEIFRVALEKVNGKYQGACFPFRAGFECGIVRLAWGLDGSLFVGMTNRGWGSVGTKDQGLQRLLWTGRMPFEIREMRARRDGFELEFTEPVDRLAATNPKSYQFTSYTYSYHSRYGSDEIDKKKPAVAAAAVAPDGRSVRLTVVGLRAGYVHELRAAGVRSVAGAPLLHDAAYYTLNEIPN